jgi:tagaturonate reductase
MRFVFSNTTEAGISYHAGDRFDDAPPVSYPAKLTRLLFERYQHFAGAADKGWVIIPCELIDYNGEALQALVLRYAASGSCRRLYQLADLGEHLLFHAGGSHCDRLSAR